MLYDFNQKIMELNNLVTRNVQHKEKQILVNYMYQNKEFHSLN